MASSLKAALAGYITLAVTFIMITLVAWALIREPPFDPATSTLVMPWMLSLLFSAAVAGLAGGWVCRRTSRDRHAIPVLIGVLVGLVLLVALVDMLVGPSDSARDFLEVLTGRSLESIPLAALLEGRPPAWFAIASYGLAVVGILAGAKLAAREEAKTEPAS